MAVLGPCVSVNMNGHNNIHSQLTKSLERILEDAYLSGELKLSGRKLKDFPKAAKFDLSDTVVADLSKNRFAEVPGEVTTYVYLEKLFLSQNVLRCLPDAVGCLQSLTYLDLSSNQLTELPREICQMPLHMLLVANNQLTSLPKDIGRMAALAELDASDNRLTQVPMSLGDCAGLRALHLAKNQLGLLPLQITYLRLEHLDVSCNCISSLPLELRNMTTLVTLNLENNPLVSPPTTICMRGRVHIFKYLESMANKDTTLSNHRRVDETRRSTKHSSYIASSPTHAVHAAASGNATIDCLRHRPRHVVDSGYSTDGVDKRWCNDGGGESGGGGSGRSTPSTPSTLSPGTALSRTHSLSSDSNIAPLTPLLSGLRISPEGSMSNGDDKSKVAHQQTYRQYKEALRQQRQQDVYKPRTDQPSPDVDTSPQNQSPIHLQKNSQSSPHSPVANGYTSSNISPGIYNRTISSNGSLSSISSPNTSQVPNSSPLLHSTPRRYQSFNQPPQTNGNITSEVIKSEEAPNRRPVQKVVPSRSVNKNYNTSPISNGNVDYQCRVNGGETYVKPTSPTKSPTSTLNSLASNARFRRDPGNGDPNGAKLLTTTVSYLKGASVKPPGGTGKLSWNKDAAPEKLSFTMKREFDKQKEESDLLQQLRMIIESRLKMSLPSELAPVLADGVVLCHLANHVRPRSVASVHVPSPAQPKLTMARCRRNVDNFLEACRRIGVEEEDICSPEDILCHHSDYESERERHTGPLADTLAALLAHATPPREHRPTFDTNSSYPIDENLLENDYKQYSNRYTEDRHILGNFNYVDSAYTIDEAEEYEANENEYQNVGSVHYSPVYDDGTRNRTYFQYNRVQFVMPFCQKDGVLKSDNLEIYDTDEVDFGVVEENREFRYDRRRMNLEIQNNLNRDLEVEISASKKDEDNFFYTCLCLGTFFVSALILIIYPL